MMINNNIEIVEKEEKPIVDKVQKIVLKATSLQVIDDESYNVAGELLKAVKGGIKQIEEYWEEPKSQAYAAYKTILTKINEMKKPLESAEKVLKAQIGAYLQIKDDERRKLEQQAKEQYGVEVILDTNAPKVEGISAVTDYEITVLDISKVPTIFNGVPIIQVDISAVKKLAKLMKGKLEIPGLKIEETKQIRSKAK